MKKLLYVMAIGMLILKMLSVWTAFAQTPKVPITYATDTDETIARRAQWIEGAKKERSLVWWGVLTPSEAERVIREFNKVYPFIKVSYWRGRGEEIATKLEAIFAYSSSRPTVDVVLGGAKENFPRWREKGWLQDLRDIVPGIENFNKRMYGKYGDYFLPAFAPKIPSYNTNLVSAAEAPKNWEDLLDPRWKGKLGSEIEADDWAALALAEGGWGIEKTENFLRKLREQKPRYVSGGRAAHTLLIAGEFYVFTMGNLRHVLTSQQKGAPVEWVRASPVMVTGPAFAMSKNVPHPNAARLFLEWQLSPPGLLAYAEISQNYVPGVATPIAKLLDGVPLIVETEEVVLKVLELGLNKKLSKIFYGMEAD